MEQARASNVAPSEASSNFNSKSNYARERERSNHIYTGVAYPTEGTILEQQAHGAGEFSLFNIQPPGGGKRGGDPKSKSDAEVENSNVGRSINKASFSHSLRKKGSILGVPPGPSVLARTGGLKLIMSRKKKFPSRSGCPGGPASISSTEVGETQPTFRKKGCSDGQEPDSLSSWSVDKIIKICIVGSILGSKRKRNSKL